MAGTQVVEGDPLLRLVRFITVDAFDLEQCEVTLPILRRPDLPEHRVAGAKIEPFDLRRADVDVVRPVQVVPILRTEETVPLCQDFQDALAVDEAVLFGLGFQDFEDELLLAERARAHDIQAARDFSQIADRLRLEIVQVEDRSLGLAGV